MQSGPDDSDDEEEEYEPDHWTQVAHVGEEHEHMRVTEILPDGSRKVDHYQDVSGDGDMVAFFDSVSKPRKKPCIIAYLFADRTDTQRHVLVNTTNASLLTAVIPTKNVMLTFVDASAPRHDRDALLLAICKSVITGRSLEDVAPALFDKSSEFKVKCSHEILAAAMKGCKLVPSVGATTIYMDECEIVVALSNVPADMLCELMRACFPVKP